jgi:drug/metabolite transporter (DMT)-like permease
MAAPTFLTAWGEQHLSSSAAGILTATDPLFTAVLALWLLRSEAPGRRQLTGLVIGFVGVIALLGLDFRDSAVELAAAGAVLLSALGYAGRASLPALAFAGPSWCTGWGATAGPGWLSRHRPARS